MSHLLPEPTLSAVAERGIKTGRIKLKRGRPRGLSSAERKRPGGLPADWVQLSLTMPNAIVEILDRNSVELGIGRSEFVRSLVIAYDAAMARKPA